MTVKTDDARDLVVAWSGYDWEDPNGEPWQGKICPTCLRPIPIVDGVITAHMRDDAPPWKPEEDHMCPGGGQKADPDVAKKTGGRWLVVDPDVGKVLSSCSTREEALSSMREVLKASGEKEAPTEKIDAERVRRFERIDFSSELAKPQKTADGFWSVAGRVARTGIQEYRDGAGGVRRELRLPEDVAASLPSFALHPLTNDHPPEMVDPDNAQKYVAGAVGEAKLDGGWVQAPLMIYRADAIAAVEAGRAQLSVGYSCRLDYGAGEWNGQKYDAIQREIVVNHVAIVDSARAGAGAAIRLDAKDAIACDTTDMRASIQENRMPHELRIDGLVFQVTDPNAQAAYDRALKQREDARAEAAAQNATAQGLVAQATKDRDTAQAARDNAISELKIVLAEKLDGMNLTIADARDAAKFRPALRSVVEPAAAARAALLVEARKHLGANEKFDAHVDAKSGKEVPAKSDLEIKRLVVEKLDSSIKLDGKSEDYVQARYDGLIEAAGKGRTAPLEQLRVAIAPKTGEDARVDAQPTDATAARRAFEQKMLADNIGTAKRN